MTVLVLVCGWGTVTGCLETEAVWHSVVEVRDWASGEAALFLWAHMSF